MNKEFVKKEIKIHQETIFQVLLLPLLLVLYLIKNFTFPVSESLLFTAYSSSLEQISTFIYHPPIYIILLHIFQLFIPDKIIACQMVGVCSIYLSALLLFRIIKKNETNSSPLIKYWLILLFITFVPIYNSMFLLDIDNTIMVPFLLFFVNYFLDNVKQTNPWKISLLLVLLFWIKEVMYPPIIIFVFIIIIIEFGIKNGFKKFLQIFIISILLSVITYGLYSHLLLNNWGAIAFNGEKLFGKVTTAGSHTDPFKFSLDSFKGLISIMLWLNPLLFFVIIINLKKNLSSYKNKYYLLFTIIYGFVLLVAWGNPGGYIKYHIPLIPFLFFLLYPAFIEMFASVNKKFILALLILTIGYYCSGDYLYQIYIMSTTRISNPKFLFLFIALYLLVPVLGMILFHISKKIKVSTVALIFLIAQNFGLLGNQILADYSTTYNYGDRGIYEVINFLKANHLENKVRFGTTDYLPAVIFNVNSPTKKEQISPQEKEYYVDRDYSFVRNAYHLPNLKGYTKIKQIGNYQIWKKNNPVKRYEIR